MLGESADYAPLIRPTGYGLIADGEARLAARGIATAWLTCAVGNDRASRFYEKCGWHRTRTMMNRLETQDGVFKPEVWRHEKLEVWRYEKRVSA